MQLNRRQCLPVEGNRPLPAARSIVRTLPLSLIDSWPTSGQTRHRVLLLYLDRLLKARREACMPNSQEVVRGVTRGAAMGGRKFPSLLADQQLRHPQMVIKPLIF